MPRPRRATGTALLVAAVLAVGGCGSDTDPSTAHTPAATEEASGTEPAAPADGADTDPASTGAAATGDDTSIEDFLTAAGIDDTLVKRLGEVGDANNYGLGTGVETGLEDRRGLATLQVTTCRDVAVGFRTWEGVRRADEAGGATEDQAAAMADFLRTDFCPHVAPLKEAALPVQTLGGPPEDDLGGRGLASPVTWWDRRHPRVSWAEECAPRLGMPDTDPVAYRLAKDEVVCAALPPAASLKNHLISVDVVFSSPVDEDRALKAALALLPSDAKPTELKQGANPDWSYLDGGCVHIGFRTATMKGLTQGLKKDAEPWASAVYYSEGATEDGAVGDYTGQVRRISLSTGADDPGASGQLTC